MISSTVACESCMQGLASGSNCRNYKPFMGNPVSGMNNNTYKCQTMYFV